MNVQKTLNNLKDAILKRHGDAKRYSNEGQLKTPFLFGFWEYKFKVKKKKNTNLHF